MFAEWQRVWKRTEVLSFIGADTIVSTVDPLFIKYLKNKMFRFSNLPHIPETSNDTTAYQRTSMLSASLKRTAVSSWDWRADDRCRVSVRSSCYKAMKP
jgi:hypothetical protein